MSIQIQTYEYGMNGQAINPCLYLMSDINRAVTPGELTCPSTFAAAARTALGPFQATLPVEHLRYLAGVFAIW